MMKERRGLLNNVEFYVWMGMMTFCAVLCWQIQKITVEESRILPLFILFIAVMSACAQGYNILKGKASRNLREGRIRKKEWIAFAILAAAGGGYRYLGFYTTIAVVLITISLLVQDKIDCRTVTKVLVYDVLLMIVTYICFAVLLGMVTPAGLLI